MTKRTVLHLGGVAATLAILTGTTRAAITGTYVDAHPADLGGNTVVAATSAPGGFYDGPHPGWTGGPSAGGLWYYSNADGGIAPDGLSKANSTSGFEAFADYNGNDAISWPGEPPPNLQTTIGGLDPLGLYDVYVQYITADWVAGPAGYGIKAGFAGAPLVVHNHEQPGNVNTNLPGGGILSFEGFIGNIQATGGEIKVDIGISDAQARSYYSGLSYVQTGQVPEPSAGIFAALATGLVLLARRRRRV